MNTSQERIRRPSSEDGFTLIEVIVVLAVVLLLTGIAVPMLSSYVEDGRRARAEAEVKVLMAAVGKVYKDVGVYPARNRSGRDNSLFAVYTGPRLRSNPWTSNHQFAQWSLNRQTGDRLDNHLLRNRPQGSNRGRYATDGARRWRGPYFSGETPLDPWGRPYVINVLSGWRTDPANFKRMWVVSAGPNGRFDTDFRAREVDVVAGDDVGMLMTQRP